MNALLLVSLLFGAAFSAAVTNACSATNPTIVAGTDINGTTSGGSTAYTECVNGGSGSNWYKWVLAAGGQYNLTTDYAYTDFDTKLAIYGSCNSTDILACDDDSGTGLTSLLIGYYPAGTYYIQVGSYSSGAEGNYTLGILMETDPAKLFACANASALTVGTLYSSSVTSGTSLISGCANGGSKWYWFTAATSGMMQASTDYEPTNFDTKVGVFAGCSDSSNSLIVCNDDGGSTISLSSNATWWADAGRTYFFQVGAFGSSSGTFGFCVSAEGVTCSGAIATPTPAPAGACTTDADCDEDETCVNGLCSASSVLGFFLALLAFQ